MAISCNIFYSWFNYIHWNCNITKFIIQNLKEKKNYSLFSKEFIVKKESASFNLTLLSHVNNNYFDKYSSTKEGLALLYGNFFTLLSYLKACLDQIAGAAGWLSCQAVCAPWKQDQLICQYVLYTISILR
jgi:hypothetical protein